MPWTTDKPPAVAKNWSADEQAKCIAAANAVMEKTGDDRQAIFACIRAAGRSERGMGERMNILEKIIDWLKGGEEVEFVPAVLVPKAPIAAGLKVAEVGGKTMWFAYTTNAFEDREGEIFATKAHEDYVAAVDLGVVPETILADLKARNLPLTPQGELWLMHIPHARIGEPIWKAVEGRFLLEVGVFDDTPMAQKAAAYFKEHDEEYKLSHGYLYDKVDREDAAYDWYWKFETSFLPVGWASNPYTAFSVIDFKEVSMVDSKKRDELVKLAGGDEALVDGFLKTASERTAKLEGEGVKHKGEPPPAAEPALELTPVPEEPKPEDVAAPALEAKAEDDKQAAAILQLAEAVKAMDTKVAGAITEAMRPLLDRIAKLEADGQTIATISRKDWLRPSAAIDNVVSKEEAEKIAPVGIGTHILDTKLPHKG